MAFAVVVIERQGVLRAMNEVRHEGLISQLFTKLNAWMLVCLFLAVSNLLLIGLFMASSTPEKTIIVPADVSKAFWVQGDKVDPVYLEQMAAFFANNLLTYNPENAIGQFDVVLRYADPRANQALRKSLTAELDDIKSKQRGSVYYVQQSKVKGKSALLFGQKLDLMMGAVIGNNMKGYQINFDYRDGKLFVASFAEVPMGSGGIDEYEKTLRLTDEGATEDATVQDAEVSHDSN